MRRTLANIFWLGTKELRSLRHDFVLLGAGDLGFSLADHRSGAEQLCRSCTTPRSRIVDEDHSELSRRIATPSCRRISSRRGRSPNATSTR